VKTLIVLLLIAISSPGFTQLDYDLEPEPLSEEFFRAAFLKLKDISAKDLSPRIECTPPEADEELSDVTVLSPQKAEELFKLLAEDKNVPFRFADEGCYARAHYMAQKLERLGVISGKVFIEGQYLHVASPESPNKEVYWGFHVASVVKVRVGNKIENMVFDPSIFSKPVTIAEWEDIQTRPPGRFKTAYFGKRFQYRPGKLSRYDTPTDYLPQDDEHMYMALHTFKGFEQKRLEKQGHVAPAKKP
jgi:hypothetical protein